MCPIAILCKEHIKSFKQNLIIVIFKAIRIDFRKALHDIYRAICNSGYSGGGGEGTKRLWSPRVHKPLQNLFLLFAPMNLCGQ